MEDVLVPIAVCGFLFVALPWIILHYLTRWKTAATGVVMGKSVMSGRRSAIKG